MVMTRLPYQGRRNSAYFRAHIMVIVLAAMALPAVGVRADDADAPMFSFSGFGTLSVVHSSEEKANFTSNAYKVGGAGYSHRWSIDPDSLIAGQVTANLTPKISAVLQVISEQNYDNTYEPHVEWANINYQFTPDFSIRAGRTVLPTFLFSETRKVGYTYPWVRPPLEVYSLLPGTNIEGLDISYRLHFGELAHTVRVNAGGKESKIFGGTTKAKHSWGISSITEFGPLTTQINYQKTYLTITSLNAFFDGFRAFGPQGAAIADKYDPNDKPLPFLSIGVSYNPGKWFMMSEWGHSNTHSFLGNRKGWYVSGGYRLGGFTPYVTYAQVKADNLTDPGLNVSTLPFSQAGPAIGRNAALNAILSSKAVQNTISIGGRWDFMKNADLKLQFDHIRIGAGSTGVLRNTQPDFQLGGHVNVFSAAIDFVF